MNKELKFERYVYIADPHGSQYFVDFIRKHDDGQTFFYILGDIFDRGPDSYGVIEEIMRLKKEEKLDMVLGNHDIFFLMAFGLHPEAKNNVIYELMEEKYGKNNLEIDELFQTYYSQFYMNQGNMTIESFERGYGSDKLREKTNEIIDFLWGFNLSLKDNLDNCLVHAGIPILDDGAVVGEKEIDGVYYSGIDYIEKMNEKMKNLDIDALKMLTATHHEYGPLIYDGMKDRGLIKNKVMSLYQRNSDFGSYYLSTWFANSIYDREKFINVRNSLREELDRKNCNRLIVGHFYNNNHNFSDLESGYAKANYDLVLRLERGQIPVREYYDEWIHAKIKTYGNFGFAIIDKNNVILEIDDVKNRIK